MRQQGARTLHSLSANTRFSRKSSSETPACFSARYAASSAMPQGPPSPAVRITATRQGPAVDVVQTVTLERHYTDAD